MSWKIPAAIAKVESDFGPINAPGVHTGTNEAHAAGPMQIGVGGQPSPNPVAKPVESHSPAYATTATRASRASAFRPALTSTDAGTPR